MREILEHGATSVISRLKDKGIHIFNFDINCFFSLNDNFR